MLSPDMLDNDVSAKVLEALNPLKSRHRMKKLNSHRPQNLHKVGDWDILRKLIGAFSFLASTLTDRPSVQEEEVSARSWVLDSIFNEVHNSVAFELCEAAKAEVTWTKITTG